MFTIPNEADAFNANQAEPDKVDIDILVAGYAGTGLNTGCEVTAQASPDMAVAVASGLILVAGKAVSVTAGNVTITAADATHPRFDLIAVNNAGVKSAVAGMPAAEPVFPAIPANSVILASVFVPANDTTIAANQIVDKRVAIYDPTPPGVGMDYWGTAAPLGWVFAYGQVEAAADVPRLVSVFGSTYGGNGTTTIGIPDKRGRVSAGKDNMGGVAANRLTSAGAGFDGTVLGAAGGAQTVALATANVPSHTHSATTGTQSANHTHTGTSGTQSANHTHTTTTGTESADHSHSGTTGTVSADHSHNPTVNGNAAWAYDILTNANNAPTPGPFDLNPLANSGITVNHTHSFTSGGRSAAHTHTGTSGTESANHTHTTTTGTESANHTHSLTTDGGSGSGTAHQNTQPTIICNYIIKT